MTNRQIRGFHIFRQTHPTLLDMFGPWNECPSQFLSQIVGNTSSHPRGHLAKWPNLTVYRTIPSNECQSVGVGVCAPI